ncbi:MAG: TonB-dependent receptor plug domain-containing protein [Reichenbachiella sp.]|uniref:TonB-dependent receptor plug domain-containing protein n=1 Tax=Reichenbachiella sp. TaxID=2184521 RepID=UPI0032975413
MRHLLFITFLMCIGMGVLKAQPILPFLQAIKQYEKKLDARFSYDPAVIAYIQKEFDTNSSLYEFIEKAQAELPVKITSVGEDFYTIVLTESAYSIKLTDSLASTQILPPFFVLINSNPTDIKLDQEKATFQYKPSLSDTIIVYAPGYEKKILPFEYLLNQNSLDIQLMTQTYLLNDVIIEDYITKGINMDPSQQNITIEVKDLPLLPGETDGDIFASLAALPGITTPDGRPGNLFIRGTAPDQSLILFDNIPMYHRGHYFGTISPYNQKVVNDVEVYRSGYHPRDGGRVGGAVYINTEDEIDNESRYGIGANTLYAMVYAKTPLNKKIGLVVGARHSYPPSVRSPKLNAITESIFAATGIADDEGNITSDVNATFQDYHVKLIAKPNSKNEISISGIYSNSDLDYNLVKGVASNNMEGINFENYGINSKWQYKINNNWSASLINTLGSYTYSSHSPSPMGEIKADNTIKDYNARIEFSRINQPSHDLQVGIDYKRQVTQLNYFNTTDNITSGVTQLVIRDDNFKAHTLSPFANLHWYGEKLSFQLGIRGSYFSPKQAFYLSPRVQANYSVNHWLNIKASTGRYHQFLSQVRNLQIGVGGFDNALWQLAQEDDGHVINGMQYMTGFTINQDQWLLDVEAFYKTANNITYYESLFLNNTSDYFTANNVLYGFDTYLKRALNKATTAWVGYSYGGSKITLDTTNQTTYKSKYVQPHVIYVGSAFQKDRWKLSGVWKYGSGLNAQSLEIAYVEVIYQRAQDNLPPDVPKQPNPFADQPERYPNVHSLDFSASYKIPRTDKRNWSATFGLSIINVFDTENLIDRAFRGNPPPPVWIDRNALGFAPNLMVMFEW